MAASISFDCYRIFNARNMLCWYNYKGRTLQHNRENILIILYMGQNIQEWT